MPQESGPASGVARSGEAQFGRCARLLIERLWVRVPPPELSRRADASGRLERSPDHAGMAGDLRAEQQGEHVRRDPGSQVGPDAANEPGIVELEDHRVAESHAAYAAFGDANTGRPVAADLLRPAQPGHRA